MEIPYHPMSPEEEERELWRDITELTSRRRHTSIFNIVAQRELSRRIDVSMARLNEVRAKKKKRKE